jgi:hypothetical protein
MMAFSDRNLVQSREMKNSLILCESVFSSLNVLLYPADQQTQSGILRVRGAAGKNQTKKGRQAPGMNRAVDWNVITTVR